MGKPLTDKQLADRMRREVQGLCVDCGSPSTQWATYGGELLCDNCNAARWVAAALDPDA